MRSLLLLVACSSAQPRVVHVSRSEGVPTSVISLDRGDCASFLIRPAMLCTQGPEPRLKDSCNWTCPWEPRQ